MKWRRGVACGWRNSCRGAGNNMKVPMPETKKTKQTPRVTAPRRPLAPRLPTEDDIASRAYELFVERGGEHGRDLDDWLSAKHELMAPES
jgi:DUF2934 family protein